MIISLTNLFAAHHNPLICLPSPLSLSVLFHSLGPICNSNSLGGANLGSEQKPTIHAGAGPFFLTRSTVNCVLCPAMQMHVDQSRHDRTTPIRGLFPKPTAAPTMPRGVRGLPLFVGETKNHDQVIFYNSAPTPSSSVALLETLFNPMTRLFLSVRCAVTHCFHF